MTIRHHLFASFLTLLACACGTSGPSGSTGTPGTGGGSGSGSGNPPAVGGNNVACGAASCGDPTFRSAVPRRSAVRINIGGEGEGAQTRSASGIGGAQQPLSDVSEYYLDVLDHVDEINAMVDDVFGQLEEMIAEEPEVADSAEHLWRLDGEAFDAVLDIDTADGAHFDLAYYEGPVGFEPSAGKEILSGTVEVNASDELVSFDLTLDLDALNEADPAVFATGAIDIAAMPIDGAFLEVWYDLEAVSVGGEPAEDSLTTYWTFSEGSYGLEYLADIEDEEVTAYVRWDDLGGRWDHHAATFDPELGEVDEIGTNCWELDGREVFDAIAIIDPAGDFYGELDGEESDCHFGPVADHPDPSGDFDDLPAEGEWTDFELASDVTPLDCDPEIDPFCDEECDPEFEECF